MSATAAERILVTGSREWPDEQVVWDALDAARYWCPGMVLVHGDCPRGADAMARRWAAARGVPQEPWPADWNRYGRRAGMLRNEQMVNAGPYAVCLAFIYDGSPGATGCAQLAASARIPLMIDRRVPNPLAEIYALVEDDKSDRTGPLIEARYAGRCPGCADRWEPGDEIAYDDEQDSWICASCAV